MNHHIRIASGVVALGLGLAAAQAGASTVELPLTGLRGGAYIQNYFVGGKDSIATDPTGPNLGFTFSTNAQAESETGAGAAGKFEGNPSGLSEVLYFGSSNSTAAYMNYAAGFSSLSFNVAYSNNGGGTEYASLYSGLNGTGTRLSFLTINPAAATTTCKSGGDTYCTWQSLSTGTLSGTAESVVFSSAPGATGTSTATPVTITEFDGLTVAPVPLPAAAWFMMSGVLGLFGFARRRPLAAA